MSKDNPIKISLPPDIEIKPEEIIPSPLNRNIEINNPDTETLFCPEKGYWVRFGFPSNMFGEVDDKVMKETLRGTPFAFMVHNLRLTDSKHFGFTGLSDVPVVFMHGYNDGSTWRFSNGQPVVDYVRELNGYLITNDMPPIELVVACNRVITREPKTIEGKVKKVIENLKDRIDPTRKDVRKLKVTDFNDDEHIAQVVAEYMMIWTQSSSNIDLKSGQITMTIGCEDEIFGFNDLIEARIKLEPSC